MSKDKDKTGVWNAPEVLFFFLLALSFTVTYR